MLAVLLFKGVVYIGGRVLRGGGVRGLAFALVFVGGQGTG